MSRKARKRIFSQLLAIGIDHEGSGEVTVLAEYGGTGKSAGLSSMALRGSAPAFAFPEVDPKAPEVEQLVDSQRMFQFVLTDDAGRRQSGYCKRFGQGGDVVCLCWVSREKFQSLFAEAFEAVGRVLESEASLDGAEDGGAVWHVSSVSRAQRAVIDGSFAFAGGLWAKPVPFPGEGFVVMGERLSRPDDDNVPQAGLDYGAVFGCLKEDTVVRMLAAVLLERRIILVSEHLDRLSSVAHALTAMCYPFSWQHIFIPVLPRALLDYCSAPMPFMLGVHAGNMAALQKQPLEEAYVLDIDADAVHTDLDDVALLPSGAASTLRGRFKKVRSAQRRGEEVAGAVSEACMGFFASIFGEYQEHMRAGELDTAGLVDAATGTTHVFLKAFTESQMYEVWARERESMRQRVLRGPFEQYLASLAEGGRGERVIQALGRLKSEVGVIGGVVGEWRGRLKWKGVAGAVEVERGGEGGAEGVGERVELPDFLELHSRFSPHDGAVLTEARARDDAGGGLVWEEEEASEAVVEAEKEVSAAEEEEEATLIDLSDAGVGTETVTHFGQAGQAAHLDGAFWGAGGSGKRQSQDVQPLSSLFDGGQGQVETLVSADDDVWSLLGQLDSQGSQGSGAGWNTGNMGGGNAGSAAMLDAFGIGSGTEPRNNGQAGTRTKKGQGTAQDDPFADLLSGFGR